MPPVVAVLTEQDEIGRQGVAAVFDGYDVMGREERICWFNGLLCSAVLAGVVVA